MQRGMSRAEVRGYVIVLLGAKLAILCGFLQGLPEIAYFGKTTLPILYPLLVAGIPIGLLIMLLGLWLAARAEESAS